MVMQSKTALVVAAATAGVAFLGYCVYFDRKRRSDPDFRKKLIERRKNRNKSKLTSSSANVQFPDMSDHDAVQRFFLQQVTKGEECLACGQIEEGVEHLSSAVAVCGQPQQLVQVLKQTLPAQVFQMLINRLTSQQHRMTTIPIPTVSSTIPGTTDSGPEISELDVE